MSCLEAFYGICLIYSRVLKEILVIYYVVCLGSLLGLFLTCFLFLLIVCVSFCSFFWIVLVRCLLVRRFARNWHLMIPVHVLCFLLF